MLNLSFPQLCVPITLMTPVARIHESPTVLPRDVSLLTAEETVYCNEVFGRNPEGCHTAYMQDSGVR